MSVIEWMQRFAHEAYQKNDQQRIQLITFAQHGDTLREDQPEVSFQLYQSGRDLAGQLNEPCWVMFFAYRMAHVCIFELEDLNRAMSLVTRDYVLSTQDKYIHCPINPAIRVNLVETYLYYDPVGYEAKIKEVITYLQHSEADNEHITLQLIDFLAQLNLKLNQLDIALNYALRTLDEGFGLLTLTRIYWERGEYDKAREMSELRLKQSRFSRFMLADSQAWLSAMIVRTDGDIHVAEVLHEQAIRQVSHINFVPNSTLFDALADYQEAIGNLENALAVRDDQLAKQNPVAGPEEFMIVRLRRARLLGRMGKINELNNQLNEMNQYLDKFKQPNHYEKLIQLINDGFYSDVVWKR